MVFEDNSDLLKDTSVRFLDRDFQTLVLSPQQEAVLEALKKINPIAAQAYYAGLCFFKKEDFPLRDFFICHSFYLLSEIFVESDEQSQFSEFDKHLRDNLRKSIKINDWFEDDVCEELMSRRSTNKQIKAIWDDLASISKGKSYRWHYFIKRFRPKIKDEVMQHMILKIKAAMKQFHSGRHYNASKYTENDYVDSIKTVEDFILALEQPYLEAKEVLDGILEEANAKSN